MRLLKITHHLLLAADQGLNCLIYIKGDSNGGWGMAGETISARAFRCYLQDLLSDRLYRLIDSIFFWEDAHCFHGWRAKVDLEHMPEHYKVAT